MPLPQSVAICSVGELFGGVERHILGLLSELQTRRIDVVLVLFHDGELAAQARHLGVEPIILPSRGNLSLPATARKIAEIVSQASIQIVHVHGYKATVFCVFAQRWHRFAIVKTEHGLPEPMTGRPLRVLRERLYHFLDTAATRRGVVAVCYVTNDLRQHYAKAHAGTRISVIPNGVPCMDRGGFQRPAELREDWFNLAIVGRLDTVKGHHIAIEALASGIAPPDAHLHIIGTGPMERQLSALAQAKGLADRVHLLAFRRDVYAYLAHCDVLLIPSLHEGLPYTLLEAMALGVPIVASGVGGLLETIENGVTGLLVPASDPVALGRAIRQQYDDPGLRRRLGDGARQLQQARYAAGTMAERYLEEYRAALNKRGAISS